MPKTVRLAVGDALHHAQYGATSPQTKRMKGPLRDVFEIVEKDESGTFRVMYVPLHESIYVLDAFKKKSKTGAEIPREDKSRILERLKRAMSEHEERQKQ